ncbi:MAG: hypothetical protein AUI59_01540 [Thaumarchaeota archaeon 13_1_40CM_2_39_13_1]|nr:MAG: hypothetical protein AUI59_01540 [Thaumarchaeota archaeon 13_1_40CM_2_39_13_1]
MRPIRRYKFGLNSALYHVVIYNITSVQFMPQAHNAQGQVCKIQLPRLWVYTSLEMRKLQSGSKSIQVQIMQL